jgi:catechol 2,3-dioxygenase-like lactoylglutathione lyase family enzyme
MSNEISVTKTQPVLELRLALTTADYDRLVRFYSDGLGLEPAALWINDSDKAMLLNLGRATIEIFDEPHADLVDKLEVGERVSGAVRLALEVPDLDAAMTRLLAKGATLVHEPVVTPWKHRNVRFCDPDGMQVTLFQVLEAQAKI